MNYSIDQLNDWMDLLQTMECDIRIDRGKRYGNKDDTLANVRRGGWMGCILSANECMERLWTMYDNKMDNGTDPDPDDLLNAVNDLRNFAGYIANLYGITPEVSGREHIKNDKQTQPIGVVPFGSDGRPE